MGILNFLMKKSNKKTTNPDDVFDLLGSLIKIVEKDDGIYVYWSRDFLTYSMLKHIDMYIGDTKKKRFFVMTSKQRYWLANSTSMIDIDFGSVMSLTNGYVKNLLGFEFIFKGYNKCEDS
jgi:hypothetical protein